MKSNIEKRLDREFEDDLGIYGIALCDYRDQYSKKRGRIIAKGRLFCHLKGRGLKELKK